MVDATLLAEAIEQGLGSPHLNLPKTENYFHTTDGLQLHFRVFVPNEIAATKMVCFWGHGYGGHANRPITAKLGAFLTANNIALVTCDNRGHGYSPGERAYIPSHQTLLDDWHAFIKSMRNPSAEDCAAVFVKPSADVMEQLSRLPYFVAGQSMSGGLSVLLSLKLAEDPQFVGIVLLAPALCASPVNPWVKWALCTILAQIYPLGKLYTTTDLSLSLKSETDKKYIELDGWGNPGAIGWNAGIHIGTAAGFVGMFEQISTLMSDVRTSFLVFHDPADGITPYDGVQQLIAQSPSEDKTEVVLEGGLHDVLTNEFDTVTRKTLEWVMARYEELALVT